MEYEEFVNGWDTLGNVVDWDYVPLPDLWVPTARDDYPLMLVTWDRTMERRVCFRPFGSIGDGDLCVRLLRQLESRREI